MSYKFRIIAAVGALVLAGCGSDTDEATPTTAAAPAPETTVQASAADLSVSAVEVDGTVYLVSCTAVSPSSLSDPLGTTDYAGKDVPARLLAGVNVSNAIAVEIPGGACAPGERQLSDWSLAFAESVDGALASQIACDSGLEARGC